MKNLVSISLTALLILSIMPTSLQASQIDTESIQVNPSFIGITSNNVNYIYSTVDLKKLHNEQSSLSEVSCQLSDFISNFDIDKKIDTLNIHTLGFKSQELDVSIDVRNCSFSANRTTERLSPKKGINDMEALEIVQNTINNMFVNNDGLFKFDKPVIQSRNDVFLSIDSPKEVNNKPEKRYNTISVFYPYVIGGTPVYTNYGTQLGATVITDEYGIVSVQTSSLPFRSTPKTSQKNTWYGLQKFIKR